MGVQLALIWAMARNGVIGRDNALPWRLPADMAYFRRTTVGHPVIMGRRTFESLPAPLPRRLNIVVSRQPAYQPAASANRALSGPDRVDLPRVRVASDLDSALALADAHARESGADTVFVIGGAALYRAALPRASVLHVTRVEADVPGDVHFPEVDWSRWRCVETETHPSDAQHAWPFSISRWVRAAGSTLEGPPR